MLYIFNNKKNVHNKIDLWLFINIKVPTVDFSLKLPIIWSPVINRNFKWLTAALFLTYKKYSKNICIISAGRMNLHSVSL